jgi:hypothetical protein
MRSVAGQTVTGTAFQSVTKTFMLSPHPAREHRVVQPFKTTIFIAKAKLTHALRVLGSATGLD